MSEAPAIHPPGIKKKLLRAETVAFVLDISARTFREWRSKGKFPPPDVKESEKLQFWKAETVDAWIDEEASK